MKKNFLTGLILLILLIAGCSSHNQITSPIMPTENGNAVSDFNQVPIMVESMSQSGEPLSGAGLLGLFTLSIDAVNLSAEMIPLRESSLTDALEVVDITNFLKLAPCTDCAKIKSVSLDSDNHVVLSIGIKHPFDVGDPFKPITGRNRADLHVFNVEGLIVSSATGTSFAGLGETVAGFTCVNADGYSKYLDQSLDTILNTQASIHPYILHFDDYGAGNFSASNPMGFQSVVTPPPSGNLVMAMGCDYDYQDYVFDLPSTSTQFIYAVGCTYAVSAANKSLRFSPEYRVPQHNKKAASEVHVEIVSNDLRGDDAASSAQLAIEVLDMNHGIAVGEGLDEMLANSSVAQIAIEVPSITASPVVISSPTPSSGSGRDPLNPLTFEAMITNSAAASEGTYTGIVKVLDSYPTGSNTSPLLNGMDGIKRVDPLDNPLTGMFSINEFATYAVFQIEVSAGVQLAACFVANPEVVRMEVDPTINFDASCSNDPNGYNIISFEWDFDWDGNPLNFSIDDTRTIPTISHTFTKPGTYTVALKVKNDATPQQTSEIFSDDVVVRGWILPAVKLTGSDVSGSMMWFYSDTRIESTSDGYAHVLVENFSTTYSHRVDYYMCNASGTVQSITLYETNEIVDTGIVVTPSDDIYAFYTKLSGEIYYRKKNGSSFDTEVFCVAQQPGNYIETAGYAVNPDGDICVLTSESRSCPEQSQLYMGLNEGSGFTKTYIGSVYRWIACSTGGGSGVMIQTDAIADNSGKFHMAWNGKVSGDSSTLTNIWYAYYDGALSSVSLLTNDSYSGGPVLRVDPDDNVWCAFATNTSNRVAIKPKTSNSFNPSFVIVNWNVGVMLPSHCSFDINPSTGDAMHVFDARLSPSNEYANFSKIFNVADSPSSITSALEFRIDDTVSVRNWWPYVTASPDGHYYAVWDDQRNVASPPVAHGDLYFAMYY